MARAPARRDPYQQAEPGRWTGLVARGTALRAAEHLYDPSDPDGDLPARQDGLAAGFHRSPATQAIRGNPRVGAGDARAGAAGFRWKRSAYGERAQWRALD